jgi:hypothetical protein
MVLSEESNHTQRSKEHQMDQDVLSIMTQFGAAGLIGLMWVVERRHAAGRERQLEEAHTKLVSQGQALEALLDVVKDNTRVIATLEQTQRQLIDLAQHLVHKGRSLEPGKAA